MQLLHEIAHIPRDSIKDDSTIDGDLLMESVVFVELQVAIEDELDIVTDPIRIVELNEFASIVTYIFETAEGR